MRYVLALGFLITLCTSADAAKLHHAKPRDVIDRPSVTVTPTGKRIFRDDSVPGGFRADHDDLPAPDDPSRRGGA